MNIHWTERSTEDYVFAIGADFVSQLEDKMEAERLSQNDLALRLEKTKGRVSQVFNHPGNLTLGNIVKYSRALGMKASVVAYEDSDPENKKGPISSKVFQTCWEKCGKPHDFWDLEQVQGYVTATVPYYAPLTWQGLGAATALWYFNASPNPAVTIIGPEQGVGTMMGDLMTYPSFRHYPIQNKEEDYGTKAMDLR